MENKHFNDTQVQARVHLSVETYKDLDATTLHRNCHQL